MYIYIYIHICIYNSEYIKIYEPSDLTLQPIAAGPTYPTRRLRM